MRFVINAKTLVTAVKEAKEATNKFLPDIQLLVDSNECLTLSTSNADQSMQITLLVPNSSAGQVAVNCKDLIGALKEFDAKDLIEVRADHEALTLTAMGITHKLSLTATEFDQLPFGSHAAEISSEQIHTIIDRLAWSAADYDPTSVLGSVNLRIANGQLSCCATDGSRLTEYRDEARGELLVNIPVAVFKMLDKLVNSTLRKKRIVNLQFCRIADDLLIHMPDATVRTRLVKQDYPRYEELIPNEFTAHLVFNRRALLNAAKSCAALEERTHLMKFHCNGSAVITGANVEGKFQADLPYEVLGNADDEFETSFCFNGNYVAQFCDSSEDSKIVLDYQGPLKPFVFHDSNRKIRHLLMPVQAK